MEIAIRHFMRGRVRLAARRLCADRALTEKAVAFLRAQSGIVDVRVNYDCASLVVHFDPAMEPTLRLLIGRLKLMSLADLRMMVAVAAPAEELPHPAGEMLAEERTRPRIPLVLPTLSLALAMTGNPALLAANIPLMAWNSFPIARRAFGVWRREKRLNVDFLDTLAIAASLTQHNQVAGGLIVWLIKLGDWIRDLTAAGSKRAIGELLEFENKRAWVLRDGEIGSVLARELRVEDCVVVYPGEMIPVDGEILEGSASIDQKTITGEGLPVHRGPGEAAFAATVLREGQITIRATRVGADTTAGQIVRLIDSAPVGDTRMQNHAEKLADKLVNPTLALAVGSAALTADFNRFLNLVIVDYGTGIRVAAPTAVLSSMTRAARSGIIIKSGRHMEKLAEVDTVVFDKTGTLTVGHPAVRDIIPYQQKIDARRLLGLSAAAESRLQHPVAEALRRRAVEIEVEAPLCDEPTYHLGRGVEGQVDGHYIHVGNERFFRESGIDFKQAIRDRADMESQGYSCLYVAADGKLAGLIPYADQIRPESRAVISRLHAAGVKNTIMLTGDNGVVARAVSRKLGLSDHFADLLPGDKAQAIKDLQAEGKVVCMVGDGINDSPALSFADVGVAMKHGAEVTHESADVVLMEDSLWKLVEAVEISRGAMGLIKQNYGVVIGLNTLALALALPGGLITPSATALISNGSAILASVNGLRPLLRAG